MKKETSFRIVCKATAEKLVGDRYILTVVPATVAELIGENKVTLNTAAYFNPNVQGGQTRAGIDMPEYAAKYIDENDIIHPATVLLTDEYGYDKDYYTDEDQPKAGTRSNGEYQFNTGEELAQGSRFSVNRNILSFHKEVKTDIKVPCGKSGGDNAKLSVKAPMDFELNYFLTLNGGLNWMPFKVYVKEFETGLEGKFAISPEVKFELHKQWELPADKFKYNVANFHGYTFTFMVGFVPVVVKCNPNMYARIDGKVTADFVAGFKYEYASTFKGGLRYKQDKGWDIIKEMKEEKNVFTFYKPTAEVHAEAGVSFFLGVDVMLYGVAGPNASVGPRLGATADLKAAAWNNAELDMKAKAEMTINAELGAKLSLLGYDIAEYHKDFELGGPWLLWQYPTNGTVHQVGKKLTQSEIHTMHIENLIEEAERRNFYGRSFKQIIDETADMKSQLYGISKEMARVQVIRSGFRFIIDPVKDIIPGAKYYEKSIVSFMGGIWANYNSTKDEFPVKMAMKELKRMMLDIDEVKQIEAAHKDKFDLIFGNAYKQFRINTGFNRYPDVNEKDIQEMIKLLKEEAKN